MLDVCWQPDKQADIVGRQNNDQCIYDNRYTQLHYVNMLIILIIIIIITKPQAEILELNKVLLLLFIPHFVQCFLSQLCFISCCVTDVDDNDKAHLHGEKVSITE